MTRSYAAAIGVGVVLTLSAAVGQAGPTPLAFPGAEGFGRFAKGGRGGDVYHVTTLEDDGPGSLRQGIKTATGPRTIIFDISGTIQLKSELRITQSGLTIAGQTAPGDGITLRDQTVSLKGCHGIIIRYIRLRLGDKNKKPGGYDTLTTDGMPDDWEKARGLNASESSDGPHDRDSDGYTNLEEYINSLIPRAQ
jgi:hypothetical protein